MTVATVLVGEWQVNFAAVSKPELAPCFLFAHGAGAPMDSNFMTQVAMQLATLGVSTYRFEFPYMVTRRRTGGRRPPDRAPVLLQVWREQVADLRQRIAPEVKLVIGGKSMGGRMASMMADEVKAAGLVCLGYPFHPTAKPSVLRTEHLYSLKTPTLIVQGTRDSLGNKLEVESYVLPQTIQQKWLADGDHDFKPRVKSGFTQQQHWQTAAETTAGFIKGLT